MHPTGTESNRSYGLCKPRLTDPTKWRKQYLAGALGAIGDRRSIPEENEETDPEKHASAVHDDSETPARVIVPDSWPMRRTPKSTDKKET